MRLISILDLHEASLIARDSNFIRAALCDDNVLVYINDTEDALAIYKRINIFCLEAHVESLNTCRGSSLKNFLIMTGKDAVSTDERITSVINFVDKEDKKLLLFSGTFSRRVGNVGRQVMFVTEKERYL